MDLYAGKSLGPDWGLDIRREVTENGSTFTSVEIAVAGFAFIISIKGNRHEHHQIEGTGEPDQTDP